MRKRRICPLCSLGCPTNRFCSVANDSDMTAVERRNKIEGGDETCMTGMNIRIVCPVQREKGGSNGSLKAHYFTSWLRIGSTAKALKSMVGLQLIFIYVVTSASNSLEVLYLSKDLWLESNSSSAEPAQSSGKCDELNVVLFQAEMPLQRWRNCQPLFSHHHSQVCPCPSRRPAAV